MKRLFWDIESSPNIVLSWRTGFKINLDHDNIIQERAIIMICYKWEGEDEVGCLTWDKGNDRELLETFSIIAGSADELIAHNGDKFDLKWFNTRNVIHGLEPLPQYKTLDTLKIAKQHFYLNSNRLDYLGKLLCDEGKIHTNYSLWKRIVLQNDTSAMKEMADYCKQDVILLERVWKKLIPYHKPTVHAGVMDGLGRWTCPQCASENVKKSKTRVTAMGMKQHQMVCLECGRYFTVSDLVFRQYLAYRYGEAA